MKKFRVQLSLLLILTALILPLAIGCQAGQTAVPASTMAAAQPTTTKKANINATGLPVVDEKITIKAMVNQDVKVPDWNNHPAVLELEKRTNIDVQWECVPSTGFVEKRNLIFATNELPDLIMRAGLSPELEVKYATSGQIIALDKIFDYAPYFSDLIKKNKSYIRSIQSPDNHVYSMPMIFTAMGGLVNKYWINSEWLTNLSLKMPTTTDELYQTLKAFVNNDANKNGKKDELGISGPYKIPYTLLNYFHGSWGLGKNSGIIANYFDVDNAGKIRNIMTDPLFKDELTYFHKLWSEGLMDKDCFSQELTQLSSKADANTVGFIANGNNSQFIGKNRDKFLQPPALKGPNGDNYWINTNTYVFSTGCAVVTSSCKYPREALRFIDYMYSEDGTNLVRLGIEGKSYKKNADGTNSLLETITKDPTGLTQDQALAKWALYFGGGMISYATETTDLSASQLPEMKIATAAVTPNLVSLDAIPRLHFTSEESTSLSSYANDIQTYLNENIVNFITGERNLSTWDSYIADLKKMNIDKYAAVYQAAYDRWLKG